LLISLATPFFVSFLNAVALIELIALNAFVEFTEGVEIEDCSEGMLIYYLSLLLLLLLLISVMAWLSTRAGEVIKSLKDLTSLMVDPILFSGVYFLDTYDFLLSLHRSSSTSEKVTHFL